MKSNYLKYGAIIGLFGLVPYLSSPTLRNETHEINKKQELELLSKEYKVLKKRNLELKVNSFIKEKLENNELSDNEKTAWSVYDLSSNEELININEELPLQSASMIKPFIALAFYHLQNQGKVSYTEKTKKQIEEMIQNSDNYCTNLIIGRIGGPKQVQKILTENYPNIFKHTQIKEYIPKGGKTYKNKSSAEDYKEFLYHLWNNKLPNSEELKRIMALPGKDRICYGIDVFPKDTKVLNKTGTTAHLIGDMGILSINPKTEYIIVGIIERDKKPDNLEKWTSSRSNVIRDFSELIYEEIAKEN